MHKNMISTLSRTYRVDIYQKEKELLGINSSGTGYWGKAENKKHIIKTITDQLFKTFPNLRTISTTKTDFMVVDWLTIV